MAFSKKMACPYFMPTAKCADGGWIHPARLPLGAGWRGRCCAPGYEGVDPSSDEIREFCNLGYASGCARLPQSRSVDAVRFSISRDRGDQLSVSFVCEFGHRPAGHGTLEYDLKLGQWSSSHGDPRVQRMAECYVQSYLLRRIQPAPAGASPSGNL